MTLQTVSPISWPGMTIAAAIPALGTWATLDAAGEYIAFLACASEDMVVSHVAFRTGVVANSPTAVVSIQTVSATGVPSGTAYNGDTAKVTTGTLTSNTTTLVTLDATATIAKGTIYAVVITIVWTAAESIIVQRLQSSGNFVLSSLPYQVTNVTGSAVQAAFSGPPILALGSSSTAFYPLFSCAPGFVSVSSSGYSNTDNAERGMRFQVPFKCRCAGLTFTPNTSKGDFNAILRSDAGAELGSSSTAFDGDSQMGGTQAVRVFFDSPVILEPATWYRATVQPSSATATAMTSAVLDSADYRSGWASGVNCHYTTFTTAGSWVDSATGTLAWMDILIDQLDDGASAGGGMLVNPGMNGRLI